MCNLVISGRMTAGMSKWHYEGCIWLCLVQSVTALSTELRWQAVVAVSLSMQAMVFAVVLLRFDWDKEVERAQALVATHADKEQDGVLVGDQIHAEDGLQEPLLSNSV